MTNAEQVAHFQFVILASPLIRTFDIRASAFHSSCPHVTP